MDNFIQKFHSGWAYLVLFILIITLLNSLVGWISKKEFTSKDQKIALFGLIFTHIQLLVGLVLYFIPFQKEKLLPTHNIDHPYVNILAVALITIGWVKHKKETTSEAKFKTITVLYGVGLMLIIARIPWHLLFV